MPQKYTYFIDNQQARCTTKHFLKTLLLIINALQKSTLENMLFFAKNTSFYVIFFEFG